jgi:hypothetical protein
LGVAADWRAEGRKKDQGREKEQGREKMKRFFIVAAVLAPIGFILNAAGATADDPAGWGTVKGHIVWGGPNIPQQKPIADVGKSNDKNHCLSKGPILDEDWVVNPKNKGICWTFVWLMDKNGPTAPLPIHPDLQPIKQKEVVMDQPCCKFVPHALGMREGQILVAKNSAPVPHNYKWTGSPIAGIGGNVLIPPNGSFKIVKLKADRLPIAINCNIHSWMRGWVRVFNHPYFAVTDENGAFELNKAPAGEYRLVVWHESAGWLGGRAGKNGQPITIKPGGTTDTGNLSYSVD